MSSASSTTTMTRVPRRHRALVGAVLGLLLTSVVVQLAPTASAQPAVPAKKAKDDDGGKDKTTSKSDSAKKKLHPKLQEQVDAGSTATIPVFVTVEGSPAEAAGYLDSTYVASGGEANLLVGSIAVQSLTKLAGAAGVVSVGPIEFAQTGQPIGDPDKSVGQHPTKAHVDKALKDYFKKEVPYSKAPPLRGSNFEALRDLAVLDAKTHDFAEAWDAGYAGEGVTVGVLDGGTDFGHPDLIGTWQVWTDRVGPQAGWNGWPKAFDPYGVLQWLAAPNLIEDGLSWYTLTTPATCKDWAKKKATAKCSVKFATMTGPSRNLGVPAGLTKQYDYQFPAGVSKSGNVRLGNHPDDYLLGLFGSRVAFLVTDSTTAGVYDTVYVDLDNDKRFDDEKPVNKASPASYRDMNGDGLTDISGGLLYYISDGATAIPGGLDAFGVNDTSFGPGELLAWTGDFDPAIGGHGTATASNIVGQGVINGNAPTFTDLPGGKYPGAVIGGAPKAKLAPFGDIYFSFEFSTQLGYFLSTRRGVEVTSNSYGSSDVDNDGFDAASQEADVIHNNRATTSLYSTGNGAPGFGTTAPPSPQSGISVGASTQFGGTGWDSIASTQQIVDDDVMVWSNRGPGANGATGVDVVADGAYSAGDVTLNAVFNGATAWDTWGGTSRSTPVAAAATALVYQSYKQNVGAIPPNFYDTATAILKSTAEDLGYDSTVQGAGSVDAAEAVAAAASTRAKVTPDEWRPGDYQGTEYPVMTHLLSPGESDTQTFTLTGPGTWAVSDRQLVQTDSSGFTFSSAPIANESVYNFNAPDYLVDLSDDVAAHPDADLMVVRVNYPRSQFDGDGNYVQDQAWRLLTYNWTDVNGDGNLWTDKDHDGVVDHKDLKTTNNPDHNFDLDFKKSEMDKGEYVRFMYHRADFNALTNLVRDPASRMADGLFLGLQHSVRNAAIPVTDFEIQIDWYENVDWGWVTTPASASAGTFNVDITVPADTPFGMYSGAVVLTNGDDSMVVPVSVAVAATAPQDSDGSMTGALTFGGPDVAAAQSSSMYNNGSVFGANDWTWRAESGDWRFFFLDVANEPADGALFLARTTWEGATPYTDLDTLIMGHSENHFQVFGDTVFGAPYVIDTVGKSPNTNIGAGVWTFDTASGGAQDFVAAPMQEGLHSVVVHQVGWDGADFDSPFTVTLGGASVAPSSVEMDVNTDSGTFDVTVESSLDLDGLVAEGFGLSQPSITTEIASQDDPNDPSTASVKENVTLTHASRLTVATALDSDDLDLFLVYDANNDGAFTNDEIVAASATGTSNEAVELTLPDDGNYQVWVQGWAVAGNPEFELTIDAIQGNDVTVTGVPAGPVTAGTPITLTVDFTRPMTVGETYYGEVLIGPPTAPAAFVVPVAITRTA